MGNRELIILTAVTSLTVGLSVANAGDWLEFPIYGQTEHQQAPDISANTVVWQDDRNGNRDIYGCNLITGDEFRITDDPADQTNPAVSGVVVVWQDNRSGYWNIYAAVLEGPEVAQCTSRTPGDVDGDCKVDFLDISQATACVHRL